MVSSWWSGPVPALNCSQNFIRPRVAGALAQYLYSRFVRGFLSLCKITVPHFLFSLQENRPFSVDFFRKMIQFEKEQESCKMENLREYYERALREFGTDDSGK